MEHLERRRFLPLLAALGLLLPALAFLLVHVTGPTDGTQRAAGLIPQKAIRLRTLPGTGQQPALKLTK